MSRLVLAFQNSIGHKTLDTDDFPDQVGFILLQQKGTEQINNRLPAKD